VDVDLRLADVLAALSVATDLGMGHEPEKAIRACLVATELARASGLPEPQVRDVYYTSMLQHLGCTATAHELTHVFGDDRGVLRQAEHTDEASLRGRLEMLALVGRGTGVRRGRYLARMLAAGKEAETAILRSTCEVGARMAERLRLGDGVRGALREGTEIWDGGTGAYGHAGDDIPVAARFSLVATQAVLFDRLGGSDAAVEVVTERAGHWFDPEIAELFTRIGDELLRRLATTDVWAEVLEVEPRPVRTIPSSQLDEVARVFADMVDLKSPFTLGHSTGVADLAVAAARRLGLPADRTMVVRRAALLHDLGRVAVSGAVWEQPRALTATEWEQVRLHPYHTERILRRSSALAALAPIAGMHHEREDGSGYHHGASGAAIPLEARLLAVADAFQAMSQPRPHRPACPPERAVAELEASADAGTLHPECVRAVVEAAGHEPSRRRGAWPAGLSDREVDVLRLVATGSTNREIAEQLVISRRTAEHHVQHIYAKIGGSTRAAAALFAMEHGLVS
jgi:response regulator RpfG family c-di-GMP phosphodiesterase/DNA-binding CsgD family transcriptional regulator